MKIISIGEFCMGAECLKYMGLKTESYPFDWMFTNPIFVKECLETDFRPLKKMLERESDHGDSYSYPGIGVDKPSIPHRDPKKKEDRDYYYRCIERFNKQAKIDGNVYLHFNSIPMVETHLYLLQDIEKELEKFNPDFTIISIRLTLGEESSKQIGRIKLVNMRVSAKTDISNWKHREGEVIKRLKEII